MIIAEYNSNINYLETWIFMGLFKELDISSSLLPQVDNFDRVGPARVSIVTAPESTSVLWLLAESPP